MHWSGSSRTHGTMPCPHPRPLRPQPRLGRPDGARAPWLLHRPAKQQTPKYMWIGCSDSRVPANQITGLEPGEVFVHRNVANIVVHSDLNALSAIQFAVELLQGRAHHGGRPLRLRRRAGGAATARASAWPTTGCATSRTCATATARCSTAAARGSAADALCELNVIEQVVNVCVSTVMVDAWAAGQKVSVHGWAFGVQRRPAAGPAHDRDRHRADRAALPRRGRGHPAARA